MTGGVTVVVVAAELRARVAAGQALAAHGLQAWRSSVSLRAALHDAATLPRPCTLLLLLPLADADLDGACARAGELGLRVLVVDPAGPQDRQDPEEPDRETLPDIFAAAARLAQLNVQAGGAARGPESRSAAPRDAETRSPELPRLRAASLREVRARSLPGGPSTDPSPGPASGLPGGSGSARSERAQAQTPTTKTQTPPTQAPAIQAPAVQTPPIHTPPPQIPLVLVGASTGGPRAVAELLSRLPADFGGAVLLAQHLLDGFGAAMVSWLGSLTPLSVELARHGESARRGRVYLAPDGAHLALRGHQLQVLAIPPEGGYRPNIDILFRSALQGVSPALLTGVLLTGMGQDGAEGLALLHRLGVTTIVQDPVTAVVASMPQQALSRFQPSHVAAPERIAALLLRAERGSGRTGGGWGEPR